MPRLLTYNVHRCVGADGRADPGRIAAVIARCEPDIVALQELDVNRRRTGGVDQAHTIARDLAMDVHFHASVQVEEERYGNAILSAMPIRLVKAGALPTPPYIPSLEPRGALWASVDTGDKAGELQVINTHLGLRARERMAQVEALLGHGWLAHPECQQSPAVLVGDFNAVPRSRAYAHLAGRLRDAQQVVSRRHRPSPTFPSRFPVLRLDHVFVSEGIEVAGVEVRRGLQERAASDHLPLVVDLRSTARRKPPGA
jgi:endonuclease/exonuclease/phosphatase family metal-dependent hydrolase